ncbi:lF-82 [Klebsiella oxytoca]|uniref:lF-82 n=1 Tax=Klebsiella aerogenes TaxID=548 RepID=UPI0027ED1DEA|nr:lF-82 [Klebsiella aerogenes]HDT4319329.1 lF-82 [Klebsiella aerogenes]HDT5519347.1 lF-82 [Klebsiella aerogenes]
MGKDGKYDIIYRGEHRDYIAPGRWVFIQRAKEVGGGYWLGRAWPDFFEFGLEQPTSLSIGMDFIISSEKIAGLPDWDDEFNLEG